MQRKQSKVISVEKALELIEDGNTIGASGFVGAVCPEYIFLSIEKKFQKEQKPTNLTVYYVSGLGDGKERGLNHIAYEGLIERTILGHYGLTPKIVKLVIENKIVAYNLPQGVMCDMLRSTASGKPGTITHVGLGTFVDPRLEGGKLNDITEEDLVEIIEINGEKKLFYHSMPIDVAIMRGTTADEKGNITMEKEVSPVETLALAQAAKNSGGKVIVQVEKLTKKGTLHPKNVIIPGIYVDAVVVSPKEHHPQTFAQEYNPSYTGDVKVPADSLETMPLNRRKVIARRATMELPHDSIVNLGIGTPEDVAKVASEEGISKEMTLTVENGPIGGIPESGLNFGASINPEAIISEPSQFNFYDGGGLDISYLGMGQTDKKGNVNASRFGKKLSGCGGFINIAQNAQKVAFCGAFTALGLEIEIGGGRIDIIKEGEIGKFPKEVEQITFSAEQAIEKKQPVLYVTERAVFELKERGLTLTEIAPGIDLEKDILKNMDFEPFISDDLKKMDSRIFKKGKMDLTSPK